MNFISSAEIKAKDTKACEDSYFIHTQALGVSDGVGGWANYGITSSKFSASLMGNCLNIIETLLQPNNTQNIDSSMSEIEHSFSNLGCNNISAVVQPKEIFSQEMPILDPQEILKKAYREIKESGSATATICVLNHSDLICANIGDSGFLLIRFDNSSTPFILIKSEEQQHEFNTPYQLCKLPTISSIEQRLYKAGIKKEEAKKYIANYNNSNFCNDDPEESKVYQAKVREGDLIIAGTDGFFDNLFIEEILEIIHKIVQRESRESRKIIAKKIAMELSKKAYRRSVSQGGDSPFLEKMKEAGIHGWEV